MTDLLQARGVPCAPLGVPEILNTEEGWITAVPGVRAVQFFRGLSRDLLLVSLSTRLSLVSVTVLQLLPRAGLGLRLATLHVAVWRLV